MAFEAFNFGKQLGIVRGGETRSPGPLGRALSLPFEIINLGLESGPMSPVGGPNTGGTGDGPLEGGGGAGSSGPNFPAWEGLPGAESGTKLNEDPGHGGPSLGSGGRNKGIKETEAEKKRREAIESLQEQLNFWNCGPVAGNDPDNIDPANSTRPCCSDEERYKIATTLYDLLNNEKVKSTPGMADCLKNAAISKLIRCFREESPQISNVLDYSNLDRYKAESLEGRWNIWDDKLGDKILLLEGLMGNCGVGETPYYQWRKDDKEMRGTYWTLDLMRISGSPSKSDICSWLKKLGWDAKAIRKQCKEADLLLVGRYTAYNVCTGEVVRLRSFTEKKGPEGTVVEKWYSGKDCGTFGYNEKDKEIGLESITNS